MFGGAEVVSTGWGGVDVLEGLFELMRGSGEDLMKSYLKFAASFWMSAFLVTASIATAQTTTSTAKPKKNSSTTNTAPTATSGSAQTQSGTTAVSPAATTTTVVAHDQQSGTTTAAPKMMVGPDKHMIPVPQQ
jgi:hypothetical protein